MGGSEPSPGFHQLLELLAVVSSFTDEASAMQAAAERAAQALEAEVAAVVLEERVAASIGFPAGNAPEADLLAVAHGEREWIEVPGLHKCRAVASAWAGQWPGYLILARWGDEAFSVEERHLVRSMARLLELTLAMLRTLQEEQRMRLQSEQQAAENARLLASLRAQQRLQRQLALIQQAISQRDPLQRILDTITAAAGELLDDEIVGLWVIDPQEPDHAKLLSSVGLGEAQPPSVPLGLAGAAGEAMRLNRVVIRYGPDSGSAQLRELTRNRLHASMAVPVHENGQVAGGLLIASLRPDRRYQAEQAQTLRTFAQNVSLALTDAHTFEKMTQASHDTLTGLASRGLFLDRLTEELALTGGTALLFIDLDRFKSVNDSLGHAAGDELLKIAAERIRTQMRPSDVAGRFGGDEFAVMLHNVRDVDVATAVAQRVVRALGDPMPISGHSLRVGASTGIALSSPEAHDPLDLLRRADLAMYQAKRRGRGRCEVFTDEMMAEIPGHLTPGH